MTSVPIAQRKSLEPWVLDSVQYYPHQIDGIRQLAKKWSFLLADDMGLGKSLQALTVFGIDVKRGWASKALVICPVTLVGNWADEIDKFTRFPHMILDGTPKQREKILAEFAAIDGPKILITNYEKVKAHKAALDKLKFDVAIMDEAHYIKNPKSQRTKACLALKARRSFLLTGTPMLNQVNELWALLHRINPVKFPNYYSFVNRYCVFGGYQNHQIVGVKNEKELMQAVHEVMLRRLKKDVLALPEVQIIERRVDLLPQQRKLYEQVQDDLILERFDMADPDEIDNALTKFLRLKQICGTTLSFTGEDHSAKLDLALEDDEELIKNGHKLVVFTQFRDVLSAYTDRASKLFKSEIPVFQLHGDVPRGTARTEIVKAWSNVEGPAIIACMLQVAGVGLNMTAARHGSFLDELFTPGMNQQAIDRMHRIGASETQAVQIRKYITRGTIENRVQQILRTKSKLFGEIIETDPLWKKKLLEALMEKDAA